MQFISWVNAYAGQNCELCISAHGRLPGILQYMCVLKIVFTDLVVLYGPIRDGVDHSLIQVGPTNIDRLPNQLFGKFE